MKTTKPIITFRVAVDSAASPEAVYSVLSDLDTHLVWAGEQAPAQDFRLLTMNAPNKPAKVGARFSSTGANSKDGSSTFHDHSVVVEAEDGVRFGFDTEAKLSRKHVREWHSRFSHRYAIERTSTGSAVRYTCEVRPQNYIPYWLRPWMRPMVRVMVQRAHRKHMLNLVALAERKSADLHR